jgi:hypothetical protein
VVWSLRLCHGPYGRLGLWLSSRASAPRLSDQPTCFQDPVVAVASVKALDHSIEDDVPPTGRMLRPVGVGVGVLIIDSTSAQPRDLAQILRGAFGPLSICSTGCAPG